MPRYTNSEILQFLVYVSACDLENQSRLTCSLIRSLNRRRLWWSNIYKYIVYYNYSLLLLLPLLLPSMCLSLLLLLVSNTTTTNSSVSVAAAAAVIPHMSDVLSSLEAAVASLNLGRSFLLMTHDTHAILGLELTELALDQHRRLLHLCNKVLTLNEIANYQCIAARLSSAVNFGSARNRGNQQKH